MKNSEVTPTDILTIKLAPGGGFVAVFKIKINNNFDFDKSLVYICLGFLFWD